MAHVERLQDTIYGWHNNGPGRPLFKNATEFTGHATFHNMGLGTHPSQHGGDPPQARAGLHCMIFAPKRGGTSR
ncbi:hypothetical protein CENSYa_1604 [Cenarchaeum symbiosum A]|uniref:Uncharacterized protein n=1 Tax=Cenarchaeum symbiosum (strain A) TaxID=414004 RepID=A0RY07_CENSY|nr:hypothetical protein CENSYa_1604 [Cenarchaeum symbiosum A]